MDVGSSVRSLVPVDEKAMLVAVAVSALVLLFPDWRNVDCQQTGGSLQRQTSPSPAHNRATHCSFLFMDTLCLVCGGRGLPEEKYLY